MSQIGQVQVNFNNPLMTNDYLSYPKALIIGVSQRGPIYKVVEIESVSQFIVVFGQPTNKYEFDFFEAVKTTVENGGIALCYRIPYTDNKDFSKSMEFFIVAHPKEKLNYNFAFEDRTTHEICVLRVRVQNEKKWVYLFPNTDPDAVIVDHVIIKGDNPQIYYKMYVDNGQLLTDETEITDDAFSEFYIKSEDETESYYVDFHDNNVTVDKVGLYLYDGDEEDDGKTNFDVIYKSSNYIDIDYSEGAKLTFNLINDFNSALIIQDKDESGEIDVGEEYTDISTEISADSYCYTGLRDDIDPSEILGVFPIFYGPRDAENLRNLNYKDLYIFGKTDYSNRIDIFNAYVCQKDNNDEPYKIDSEIISNDVFAEFERDTHFTFNWAEKEVAKLIDANVPQDIDSCPNTLGVAFFGIYLNDEHKLDYILLESFYGLVGISNNRFRNLEDLINKKSKFFRVEIDGSISEYSYIRALSRDSFIEESNKWIVPFFAPTPRLDGSRNIIDTDSIFAEFPDCKCTQSYDYSLSKLFDKLEKTEFLNSVPFDYMLEPIDDGEVYLSTSSMVPYDRYQVDLSKVYYGDAHAYTNIKNFYKMISLGTRFGDKGTIAFIDIPEKINTFIIENLDKCFTDTNISDMLSIHLNKILPQFKKSSSEIYDRTYPLYNYQYADRDGRLTRYHKFRPLRKFEIVPGSSIVVGAYVYYQLSNNFDPLAGPRSADMFALCHKSLTDMSKPQLFKILFDLYGITSLINNKDNQTFPIQQTTWKNSYSVLKQLHAFRIYVELRRRAYGIVKSYLYETNTEGTRKSLKSKLNTLLYDFKEQHYIDNSSFANVWADIQDIEGHQIQVEMNVGIFGAIVKIIINMNLRDMKIEIVS